MCTQKQNNSLEKNLKLLKTNWNDLKKKQQSFTFEKHYKKLHVQHHILEVFMRFVF